MSPDLLDKTRDHSVIPFYQIKGHKIYLNTGFWILTRAWIRIFQSEIEKYCPCDLDPDLILQEATDYLPQGFFRQKILNPGKDIGRAFGYKGAHLTAQYGYTVAGLKLSAEVAETLLSLFVGGKGIHVFCNAIDVMIFPLARRIQKYIRVFSYGGDFGGSGLLASLRMAWFSRQVEKSQKKVFFYIDQAVAFRETELEKINGEGPRSFFHKRGHRRLWIESLKRKTDPLFEEIAEWEQQQQDQSLSSKEKRIIKRKIEKTRHKIENISKVNQKDFFGVRFKRYLLLRSRKARVTYMQGRNLPDEVIEKDVLWPLSLQENVIERALESHPSGSAPKASPDEIREGLAEEFLLRRAGEASNSETGIERSFNNEKQAVQFFLEDIAQIFNTEKSQSERLMTTRSIEMTLGALFAHYLKISHSVLSNKYGMSFSEKMRLQWAFGRFFHLVYEFSDFLSFVSITKNKAKIQFYKYESMEKLLAFFDYLNEIQLLLKGNNIDKLLVFDRLNSQERKLRTISLSTEKKIAFSFLPFKKRTAQCKKLVEKYQ